MVGATASAGLIVGGSERLVERATFNDRRGEGKSTTGTFRFTGESFVQLGEAGLRMGEKTSGIESAPR